MARIIMKFAIIIAGLLMVACGESAPKWRWEQKTIQMVLDGSLTINAADAAILAMEESWNASDHDGPQFTWSMDTSAGNQIDEDGRNLILMGPAEFSGREDDLGDAICWWDTDTGVIHECDILLNVDKPWIIANPGPDGVDRECQGYYDLWNLLAHELGHVLGLDDQRDEEDEELTMFFTSRMCEVRKRSPEAGDLDALNALYGN